VDYLLHDQPVRFLKGTLRLRQVTHLCDDGHQAPVRNVDSKIRAAGFDCCQFLFPLLFLGDFCNTIRGTAEVPTTCSKRSNWPEPPCEAQNN
jgi:hypothetical protein